MRFIQELMQRTSYVRNQLAFAAGHEEEAGTAEEKVSKQVLDVGTGHIAIYALLGCASYPSWCVTGTEVDPTSIDYARTTIASADPKDQRKLSMRISILLRSPSDSLIPSDTQWDATMCNPPFYSSDDQRLASAEAKALPPPTSTDAQLPPPPPPGTSSELVCSGGEVEFARRMVSESVDLKGPATWYTTLLGHKSSVATVLDYLKEKGVRNTCTTTLSTGGPTRRWVVAWSLGTIRPRTTQVLGVFTPAKVQELLDWSVSDDQGYLRAEMGGNQWVLVLQAARWVRAGRRAATKEPDHGPLCAIKLELVEDEVRADWLLGSDVRIWDAWVRKAKLLAVQD